MHRNKKTVPAEISSTKVEEKDRRKAKFVLYYMTTTLTSTSTSISTSSSYTGTIYNRPLGAVEVEGGLIVPPPSQYFISVS